MGMADSRVVKCLVALGCIVGVSFGVAGCDDEDDCGLDCALVVYNACTCGPSDPCGWIQDGYCDTYTCASVTDNYFDDSIDCGAGAACAGECGLGYYSECTCDPSDPCGWNGDGYCDQPSCESAFGFAFDDSLDCGGAAGACDGACAALQYTACTCGVDDPCGWAGDGSCDETGCFAATGGNAFDDSSDCSTSSGELSFGVTAVRDDLDNRDLQIMADGFQQLGYESMVRDLNVSSNALAGYMAQDITTLYHTGHGFEEGIATADGVLYISEIQLGVRNAIIATCLALDGRWDGCFGAQTETVLGYNKVSFDFIDDEVATSFLNSLAAGSDYPTAWYSANSTISAVSDRWVIYVREGGTIVEYSARSGDSPRVQRLPTEELISLGRSGRIRVASRLLEAGASPAVGFRGASAVSIAESGLQELGSEGLGWRFEGTDARTAEEAQRAAEVFFSAQLGAMPEDARLAQLEPLFARRQDEASEPVGWTVRYERVVDGLPLRSNRRADHLLLLMNADGPLLWSIGWSTLSHDGQSSLATPGTLLFPEAIRRSADDLARRVKGQVDIISARPVYGALEATGEVQRLIPAWEIESADGSVFVIDALTGNLLI